MVKYFLLFALSAIVSLPAIAQNPYINDTRMLMKVGDTPVTVEEFMNVYLKNNNNDILDKKTVDEYINMYSEFKYRVNEAEYYHIDTTAAFRDEMGGYRKDLAKPYFTDEKALDHLINEAYQRMQEDVRVSHILIFCNEEASPKDTLAAYKKIEDIRKRIGKGEDFGELAVALSDDPSARDSDRFKGNRGDLGYFTVFNMVYPFESAAYSTPNHTLSPIVRSSFGYHLIKVTDRKPALGRVQVSHIFFSVKPDITVEQEKEIQAKADEVYKKLQEGEAWEKMVYQYSEDQESVEYDGVLPWFVPNRMAPEFVEVVYDLKNPGDISKPIKTYNGYHILRLEDKKPVPPFDEIKYEIRSRVLRDSRSKQSTVAVIEKIKKEYGYIENQDNLKKFLAGTDASILTDNWNLAKVATLHFPLITLGDSILTTDHFIAFIQLQKEKEANKINPTAETETAETLVKKYFKIWSDETCTTYEDCRLEAKHPEFRLLLKEYRDGILLYEMIEREVWGRSTTDSVGLENFFAQNRNKYYWKERRDYVDITISGFRSQEEGKKAEKALVKLVKKDKSDDELKAVYADNDRIYYFIDHYKVEKGIEKKVDALWDVQLPHLESEVLDNNIVKIFKINRALPPEPKELNETRGMVIIDYQEFLEKEWMDGLRKKYPIQVNQEVLNSLKK